LGSHRYGFHWTGDNRAEWAYLKGSIADNFNFQLYGTQMVGPDICGFGGDTTEELCSRWFQLAALYPFTRNHNDHESISQEPYALGDTVLAAARNGLKFRYSILKYYYTLFITKKGLGSIFKPMFFAYPGDNNAYVDEICDTQFLVGLDLLAAPILVQNTTSRKVYLPESKWYNFHTGQQYLPGTYSIENVSLTEKVPLFMKEGSAILVQDTQFVRQTRDLGNIYQLVAGLKLDGSKSTDQIKYYRGSATILSIKDFNDDSLVSRCISQGCAYSLNFILTVTEATRSL
jgi:alpha-glucosidase (family GH31 glycosyl hydrolase)